MESMGDVGPMGGSAPQPPHLVGRYRGLRVGGGLRPPPTPPEIPEEAPPPQTPPENYFRILAGGAPGP